MSEREHGPRLYIQRVLIMEHCKELLPRYLRFVTGLVDCSDLPLNISREILQHNDTLEAIRKDLIREIFKALRDLRESELPAYETFFKGFGTTLKEGVREDHENREKVADLLLYPSLNTPVGEHTTLERYIAAMPEGQKDIYYLTGDSDAMLRASPKLEAYRAKGRDVLFMIDAVDEYILPSLSTFKGKSLRSADSEKAAEEVASPPPEPGEFAPLLDHLKKELTEVSDVRLSSRLIDSPACLVTPSGGMSGHLERLLDRMGQGDRPKTKRILELNAGHAAVLGIKKIFEANAEDVRVAANARLLVDQAMLADGSPVEDLAGMAKRLGDLIARDAR
jgi:molecular chaperone HtpG